MKSFIAIILTSLQLFSQGYYPQGNMLHLNLGSHLAISQAEYEGYTKVDDNPTLFANFALGYSYHINRYFNIEAEIDVSPFTLSLVEGGGIDDHKFEPEFGFDLSLFLIMSDNYLVFAGLRYSEGTLILDDEKDELSLQNVKTSSTALQFGFRYAFHQNIYYTLKIALPEMNEQVLSRKITSKDIHFKLNATIPLN